MCIQSINHRKMNNKHISDNLAEHGMWPSYVVSTKNSTKYSNLTSCFCYFMTGLVHFKKLLSKITKLYITDHVKNHIGKF